MFSISLIVVFSLVLFIYWFRYSCLLILQTRSKEMYLGSSGNAKGLSFPVVQERLRADPGTAEALDRLNQDLRNDFRVLSFLLRNSSALSVDPVEQRMLILDYRLMQIWYQLTRRTAPPHAREALDEMANILSYFAHSLARHTQHSEA